MEKRNYTHIQALLPEIKTITVKTQREFKEHYGFRDSSRGGKAARAWRRKERKLKPGSFHGPKGRPRKDAA